MLTLITVDLDWPLFLYSLPDLECIDTTQVCGEAGGATT